MSGAFFTGRIDCTVAWPSSQVPALSRSCGWAEVSEALGVLCAGVGPGDFLDRTNPPREAACPHLSPPLATRVLLTAWWNASSGRDVELKEEVPGGVEEAPGAPGMEEMGPRRLTTAWREICPGRGGWACFTRTSVHGHCPEAGLWPRANLSCSVTDLSAHRRLIVGGDCPVAFK